MKYNKFLWWFALTVVALFFSTGFTHLVSPSQAQSPVFLPLIVKAPYEPNKGVVIPDEYLYCADLNTLNVGWYYRSWVDPIPDCPPDRRFVPRLSDAKAATPAEITKAINSAQASGWIIGFTEPNINYWNGYVTPMEGADIWRKIENQALPAGIKLVAPSPSQHDECLPNDSDCPIGGDATVGYTWIWKMIEKYEEQYDEYPHFDAFGWNYYDRNPSKHKKFLSDRRAEADSKFGGYYKDTPFWILEYGGSCWDSKLGDEVTGNGWVMRDVTPWLEVQPWISRYAWFANRISPFEDWHDGWQSCSLLKVEEGKRTTLGEVFAGF